MKKNHGKPIKLERDSKDPIKSGVENLMQQKENRLACLLKGKKSITQELFTKTTEKVKSVDFVADQLPYLDPT